MADQLTDNGRELTRRLLTETREELVRADGKAQVLLAASGVVIGVVLGGILADDWQPDDLACGAQVAWWVGVVAAGLGLGCLVAGIWPRVNPADPDRVTYFSEAAQHANADSLIPHLNREAKRADRDAEQLWRLSRIARKKYGAVRAAIALLVVAVLLCTVAAAIG